jgi:hypothetical protein
MTETWKAFVINQTTENYTILSERDKKYHILPLPITFGNVRLDDGSVVTIQDMVFSPHKLYMACKEYDYNIKRKKSQYQKRLNAKSKTEESTTNNPFTQ